MNFNYDKDESCDKINSSYNKEDSSYEDFINIIIKLRLY